MQTNRMSSFTRLMRRPGQNGVATAARLAPLRVSTVH
jgi:hypothetical protein